MNVITALNVEKAWISVISQIPIKSYLDYDESSPVDSYTFLDEEDNIIAIFNKNSELKNANLGPGFFLVQDSLSGEEVLIELSQTIPCTVR